MADMTRERAMKVLQCSIDAWKICKASLSQEDLENETGNALRERAEAAEIGIAVIKREKETVRCRDCKFATVAIDGTIKYCSFWAGDEYQRPLYLDNDFYCAAGERKEVEHGE